MVVYYYYILLSTSTITPYIMTNKFTFVQFQFELEMGIIEEYIHDYQSIEPKLSLKQYLLFDAVMHLLLQQYICEVLLLE